MDKDLHNIDKLFKNAIEDHEEMPSPGVWQNLDTSLDKSKVVHILKKYEYLKKVAFTLVLFALAIGMYALKTLYFDRKAASTNSPAQKNSERTYITPVTKPNGASSEITIKNKPGTAPSITIESVKTGSLPNTDGIKSTPLQKNYEKPSTQSIASNSESRKKQPTADDPVRKGTRVNAVPGVLVKSVVNMKKSTITKDAAIEKSELNNSIKAPAKEISSSSASMSHDRETSSEALLISSGNSDRLHLATLRPVGSFPILQNSTMSFAKINKHKSPLSITVFFSPDLTSGDLKSDKNEHREDDKNEIEKREQNSFSSTAGIMVGYDLGTKWMLQSGLTLSTSVITIQPKTIYARADNNGNVRFRYTCSSGYTFLPPKPGNNPALGDSIKAFTSKNTLQYAEVPVALNYRLGAGKFHLIPMTGISFNFLTKQNIETEIQNGNNKEMESIDEIQGMKSFYLNGFMGLGAEFELNKTLAFSLIPTARFAITSINKDAPVKSYPKSIGLAAGIRIKL